MSNSKNFLVTTVSGKQLPRKQCRYIGKQYHEVDVDCFFMPDSRWHRVNNGQIEYDNEVKTYVLLDRVSLSKGIVGVLPNGDFKYGYFSSNKVNNVTFNENKCMSEELLKGIEVEEELSTGYLYSKGSLSKSQLTRKKINNRYSFSLDYSAAFKLDEFMKYYVEFNNGEVIPICRFTDELGGKSFGMEFETSNGFIPERKLYKNGLIPLRDGSLEHDGFRPFEFTTVPLSGDRGINTVKDISELLKKHTEISSNCSLHIHIGGYKPSYEYVVGLYRLMHKIQDEIFTLFPSNYKYTSENGFKAKDYCPPLKAIRLLKGNTPEENFTRIYDYYCEGYEPFRGFGATNHPSDRGNQRKWGVRSRYYLLNIVPFIWGNSGTLEWRCHLPTQNIDKIINWLFISNGVLKYVEKYANALANFMPLTNVDLNYIMKDVYSTHLASKLINYMDWRKDYMQSIDPRGEKEIANDLEPIPVNCRIL